MDHDFALRAVLIVVMLMLLPFGMYHRIKSQSTGERLDRRQEGLFILATLRPIGAVMWLSVLAWMINPRWMAWASLPLPIWLRWTGMTALVAGALVAVWTFRSLGTNLTDTVVTRETHTLVVHGPYQWIRHPLMVRTRTEEKNLVARFGDSYQRYMDRTGRFLPRITLKFAR